MNKISVTYRRDFYNLFGRNHSGYAKKRGRSRKPLFHNISLGFYFLPAALPGLGSFRPSCSTGGRRMVLHRNPG